MAQTALVIEDDEDIAILEDWHLRKEGYMTVVAKSAEEGLAIIKGTVPSVIILDLMLPGMDGLTMCKTIRSDARLSGTPIIIVSAKGAEADVVRGLEIGADDYVVKPFSPKILVARVKAVLRRNEGNTSDPQTAITVGEISIHPDKRYVMVDSHEVKVTSMEFDLLYHLARHRGRVFTRYQIVDSIHGEDYSVTDRSVDVCVAGLRKKLGQAGEMVETVRGVGYRLREQ